MDLLPLNSWTGFFHTACHPAKRRPVLDGVPVGPWILIRPAQSPAGCAAELTPLELGCSRHRFRHNNIVRPISGRQLPLRQVSPLLEDAPTRAFLDGQSPGEFPAWRVSCWEDFLP